MLSEAEIERYARHIVLPEIGGAGQQKLKAARVLVVGAGGLGAPVLLYLSAAGVGTLVIADDDSVSVSNLQRQVIHDTTTVAEPKTHSAAAAIGRLNPFVQVEQVTERLGADNAAAQSVDAHRLQQLVKRCLPALRSALLDSTQPILLLNPGLLARFELLHLIAELEAEVGRPGRTPALWLLLPTPQPQVASIDGQILPLVLEASFAAIPRAWLENQHRAAA